MAGDDFLAEQFEAQRGHLRGVAFRLLGSATEAEDAVQEAWLRVARAGAGGVHNLGGWLTTVVARVALDMLRARRSRREGGIDAPIPGEGDPEQQAALADSVGLALLVVLETLAPAERLAFVLHDLFGLPFEEIAPIVGRTPVAARQLASRARRRVQGADAPAVADRAAQRRVAEAYLAAVRSGDLAALVALLDPDVVLRTSDGTELHGAGTVARNASAAASRAPYARVALVDGHAGLVVAPGGRLAIVLRFDVVDGVIHAIQVITDPAALAKVQLALLDG